MRFERDLRRRRDCLVAERRGKSVNPAATAGGQVGAISRDAPAGDAHRDVDIERRAREVRVRSSNLRVGLGGAHPFIERLEREAVAQEQRHRRAVERRAARDEVARDPIVQAPRVVDAPVDDRGFQTKRVSEATSGKCGVGDLQ
jgi:hypothetical protein